MSVTGMEFIGFMVSSLPRKDKARRRKSPSTYLVERRCLLCFVEVNSLWVCGAQHRDFFTVPWARHLEALDPRVT